MEGEGGVGHAHRAATWRIRRCALIIAAAFSVIPFSLAHADDWISRFGLGPEASSNSRTLFLWSGQERDVDAPPKRDERLATDRPDFTEASTTVGRGMAQVELGYTYFRDENEGTVDQVHTYPEMLWRIGILQDWLELRIAHTQVSQYTDFAILPDENAAGGGDLYLGVKLALTDQEGWLPEMALVPQMFVPVGHAAFTANETLPGINWLYGWDVTETFSIGASTQGNKRIEDSGNEYFQFAQSITFNFALGEHLGSYIEWFVLAPSGAEEALPEHYLDGGFTFPLTDNLQFDVRAGVGLNQAAVNFFSGTGMGVRF
jgi:hypothetical protein